ncbi:hypothetical protein Pla52n_21490 [Stieleria varia]|uniref:Uncharacterized protein n=1 Tax=Stieleria varia TaxID=2528005 RepID=A0A5C6B3C1_9BACT|nr:hypothetical protein Pla52n_21490 [Stieleria varia]
MLAALAPLMLRTAFDRADDLFSRLPTHQQTFSMARAGVVVLGNRDERRLRW